MKNTQNTENQRVTKTNIKMFVNSEIKLNGAVLLEAIYDEFGGYEGAYDNTSHFINNTIWEMVEETNKKGFPKYSFTKLDTNGFGNLKDGIKRFRI